MSGRKDKYWLLIDIYSWKEMGEPCPMCSIGCALSYALRGCWFDSRSGHIPRLRFSLQLSIYGCSWSIFLSHIAFLSLLPSLFKINIKQQRWKMSPKLEYILLKGFLLMQYVSPRTISKLFIEPCLKDDYLWRIVILYMNGKGYQYFFACKFRIGKEIFTKIIKIAL